MTSEELEQVIEEARRRFQQLTPADYRAMRRDAWRIRVRLIIARIFGRI